MHLILSIVLTLIFLVLEQPLKSQAILFNEVSLNQGVYVNYFNTLWGEGVSFFDFDEDGWDDLTICQMNGPVILYRNNNGYFEPQYYFFAGQQAMSSCWGDLDNDGFNDLVITTYDNSVRFYKNINNFDFIELTELQNIPVQQENLYTGIALGDMNRDGLLDIAVANYSCFGKNLYLKNKGNFLFELIQGESQFIQTQKNAFQHAFIDLDKNLWPEIYVINDYYQGNDYFKNQGNFNYSDNDTTLGLYVKADAMSNSWNDYDNDGDLDLYVTNRFFGNHFMKQIDSLQFENIGNSSGADLARWCWSATWIDADNNTLDDLLITQNSSDIVSDTSGNRLFMNSGNDVFHQNSDTSLFPVNGYACSVGDFNNDGKSDLALSTRIGYNFQLYKNSSVHTNNFFKFRLEGTSSNRNGIGTHYEVWTQGLRQYGYTQSGENYLAQNSQNLLLGIGDATIIDSVILMWPSGITDRYYNLPVNQMSTLQESNEISWYTISDSIICSEGDTVWLETALFGNPIWWDQSISPKKAITQPGIYTFSISTTFNESETFSVEIFNPTQNISIVTENNICINDAAGILVVTDSIFNQVLYSASNLQSGTYPISILHLGCLIDTAITIETETAWNWDLPDSLRKCSSTDINWESIDDSSQLSLISYEALIAENYYLTTWQNEFGCIADTILPVSLISPPSIQNSIEFINPNWICSVIIDGAYEPYLLTGLDWNDGSFETSQSGDYPYVILDNYGCSYYDTIYISPITSTENFGKPETIWLFNAPYLLGPLSSEIQVFNSLGQLIPVYPEGHRWLLNNHDQPRWVLVDRKFYPIHWVDRSK